MVSTRSNPAAVTPSPVDLAAARLIPDDPPPSLPISSPILLATPLAHNSATNGAESDSDAPDEQPMSVAASAARAQLRLEQEACATVREQRRARRRARNTADEHAVERRKRKEDERVEAGADSEGESGKKGEVDMENTGEENGNTGVGKIGMEIPLLLPQGVLAAAAGAMEKKRRDENMRRKEERLRNQRRVVGKDLGVRELGGGMQVTIVGRRRSGRISRQRGNRETAAAFLKQSLKDGGVKRVSAARAVRMASRKKVLQRR